MRKPVVLPLTTRAWPPPPGDTRAAVAAALKDTDPHPITRREQARALLKVNPRSVAIVGRYLNDSFAEVFSAAYIGLELAVACTVTQMETGAWRGAMIYGSDPGSAWMSELWGRPVTKVNYEHVFLPGINAGKTSNGVGKKQLTSVGLIRAADARGGCWVPQHNCAEGDAFFLALIRQTGSLWDAAYSYNGSGSAAVNYANEFIGVVGTWRQRLA